MADGDNPPSGFPSAAAATASSPPALRAARERLRERMFGHSHGRPRLGGYVLLEPLGAGGMGEVFLAQREDGGEQVALKVLRDDRPDALARLKAEFRVVADLHHPGLVRLGELDAEGEVPFFTMERVEGEPFDRALADALQRGSLPFARDLLLRLVDALETLHDHDRLHRDLKPSNVLVTATGRVVVLDFGLTSELAPDGLHRTRKGRVLGTPQFMAPEQLSGQRLGPSADWYGVGAMLAAALLGAPPEPGGCPEHSALAASSHPPVWKTLCLALCHPDPDRRAGGAQVRVAFGLPGRRERPGEVGVFVGREGALGELVRLSSAGGTGPQVVVLEGESGIGKTALLARFAARFEAQCGGLVLSGRCRERERVPLKGLEEIHIELTAHLADVSGGVRASVPPVGSLTAEGLAADLDRGVAQQPLVLALDDVQWAGPDSEALLEELWRLPNAPRVTWLLSGRTGATGALLSRVVEQSGAPEVHRLQLGGLEVDDAAALVRALDPTADAARVQALCLAAKGHPRWLSELAVSGADARTTPTQLYARVLGELGADAQRLLRVVSAAVTPLPLEVAGPVAEVGGHAMSLAQELSSRRLISMFVRGGAWLLHCPWEPIRHAALQGSSEAACMRLHAALARALSGRSDTAQSTLLEHYRQAGAVEDAIEAAERAGDDAMQVLAFLSAAAFYAEAQELGPTAQGQRSRVLRKRADALAAAGRGDEADACFEAAVQSADDPRTLELAIGSWRAFQRAMGRR